MPTAARRNRDQDRRAGRHARVHVARAVPAASDWTRAPISSASASRCYEALYGIRPVLARIQASGRRGAEGRARGECAGLAAGNVVARAGRASRATVGVDGRLLAALGARADRLRSAAPSSRGAALAVALVAFGGWRVARGGQISCAVPAARLAAAWSGHERCAPPVDSPRVRRQRAARPPRPAWQRVSRGARRLHRPVVGDVRRRPARRPTSAASSPARSSTCACRA